MKKILSSIVAAAAVSSAAMAAPSIATNNIGDFLIAPAEFANNGYVTDLRVINTDYTHSVLVRVVVRDSACSKEVDFPILLSPGDVWDGEIYQDADGDVYIKSTDDSNYLPQLTIGKGLNLTKANDKAAGKFQAGYVEFYPIAQYDEGAEVKINKALLAARYKALESGDTTGAEPVDDVLTGVVTLKNDTKQLSMSLPMTAISGAADEVNSGSELSISKNTSWDNYFGANAPAVSALFKKSDVVVPFVDGENMALFTFINDHTCPTQARAFTVKIRDTEENAPIVPSPEPTFIIPNELGYVVPSTVLDAYQLTPDQKAAFSKGWMTIKNLTNQHNGQDGAGTSPYVIPTQLQAVPVGGAISTNWMYLPSK